MNRLLQFEISPKSKTIETFIGGEKRGNESVEKEWRDRRLHLLHT